MENIKKIAEDLMRVLKESILDLGELGLYVKLDLFEELLKSSNKVNFENEELKKKIEKLENYEADKIINKILKENREKKVCDKKFDYLKDGIYTCENGNKVEVKDGKIIYIEEPAKEITEEQEDEIQKFIKAKIEKTEEEFKIAFWR